MEPDNDQRRKLPRAVTLAYLEQAALDYLSKYASSSENLRRVLMRKVERRCRLRGESAELFQEMVMETVAKTLRIGLVDDRAYAEARVATLRRRGNSDRLIQAKLAAKGLDYDAIHQALVEDDGNEAAAAQRLVRRRRLGPHRMTLRQEHRDKDIAALMRSGFSFSVAAAAIDDDMGDTDQ